MERRTIYEGQQPAPEQIERLRALKNRPIVFDEDCPELTEEQLRQFKRVNPLKKKVAS